MDEISSSDFRKNYARLTMPTKVMANGHLIGVWTPASEHFPTTTVQVQDTTLLPKVDRATSKVIVENVPAFNSRPFKPVPKGK